MDCEINSFLRRNLICKLNRSSLPEKYSKLATLLKPSIRLVEGVEEETYSEELELFLEEVMANGWEGIELEEQIKNWLKGV